MGQIARSFQDPHYLIGYRLHEIPSDSLSDTGDGEAVFRLWFRDRAAAKQSAIRVISP